MKGSTVCLLPPISLGRAGKLVPAARASTPATLRSTPLPLPLPLPLPPPHVHPCTRYSTRPQVQDLVCVVRRSLVVTSSDFPPPRRDPCFKNTCRAAAWVSGLRVIALSRSLARRAVASASTIGAGYQCTAPLPLAALLGSARAMTTPAAACSSVVILLGSWRCFSGTRASSRTYCV